MVAWGTSTEPVPLFHGLGAIAGEVVPVHPDLDLISTRESGDSAAATLSTHHGALLLANGGFAVGDDLLEAATRLWFLEERASVALEGPQLRAPVGRLGAPSHPYRDRAEASEGLVPCSALR